MIGLLNTLKIVEDCNLEFPLHKLLLPLYDCKDNLPASTYLCELAKKGLSKRLNFKVGKDYQERLVYELNIINKMGFWG